MRDKKKELRRFVPTAVRRPKAAGDLGSSHPAKKPALGNAAGKGGAGPSSSSAAPAAAAAPAKGTKGQQSNNKDALYSQFLNEMSDLLE